MELLINNKFEKKNNNLTLMVFCWKFNEFWDSFESNSFRFSLSLYKSKMDAFSKA